MLTSGHGGIGGDGPQLVFARVVGCGCRVLARYLSVGRGEYVEGGMGN